MKFFNKPNYFCSNCKKIVEAIEELYFVEETSPRAYCSEKCIEEFYFPFIDTYENQKALIRDELNIVENDLEEYLSHPDLIDALFTNPDEVWVFDNLLKEEIYIFVKEAQVDERKLTLISLCLVFNHRPSFVLAVDITESSKIADIYRMGKKIEDLTPFYEAAENEEKNVILDPAEIEQRKASLLAALLQNRKDFDITVEKFPMYEVYTFPTIEGPDLVNEWVDDGSQDFHICSKAFELEGNSFYYIVVCMPYLTEKGQFIPVLGFPTVDGHLYSEFTSGKKLSGVVKN